MFGKQSGNKIEVVDTAMNEDMTGITIERSEVFEIARVGQGNEIDDELVGLGQPVKNEVAADSLHRR